MNFFTKIMDALNENKSLLIKTYPKKSSEVMRRLDFTLVVGLGKYVIQKKPGYNIVKMEEHANKKRKEKKRLMLMCFLPHLTRDINLRYIHQSMSP